MLSNKSYYIIKTSAWQVGVIFIQKFLATSIVQKDVSKHVEITKPDDDEHGVPFTPEEIELLWKAYENHTDNIDMVLILIYSGWRIGELLTLKLEDIDLENLTYKGGIKTAAGKNNCTHTLKNRRNGTFPRV